MRVTRRYRFCASHRLHTPQLSGAENRTLYGKCNNPYGHGHNYVLEIAVSGPVDAASGRTVDVRALDALVEGNVVSGFDHRDFNTEVPGLAGVAPTTENIAAEVQRRLLGRWKTVFPGEWPRLEKIRIYETRRNVVELAASYQE